MNVADQPTVEAPKRLNLAQKILAIQNSVGVVHKKGKNREHNYEFLRIEDAVVAVNKLLVLQNLLLTATLQKKPAGTFYFDHAPHITGADGARKGYIVKVVWEWTIEDVVTGETRKWDIPGEGYDTTDKGTYKADTGSRKQAIILIFNLPVGND